MDNSESRTINVSKHFLTYGKKTKSREKNKNIVNKSELKTENVKELLLRKLKEYKKDKHNKHNIKNKSKNSEPVLRSTQNLNRGNINNVSSQAPIQKHVNVCNSETIPYGNLKNGKKQTFRNMLRQTRKDKSQLLNTSGRKKQKVEVEINKKFNVGRHKNRNTIGVFLRNNATRRKSDQEKMKMRKTDIKTVKNYLKTQNLIKFGSQAPNELLREIFDTSKMCGDIYNSNGGTLLHNYMKES